MIKWICLMVAGLLTLAGIAWAEEDISSSELVQFAVNKMGNSNQDAQLSGFDTADSEQIGYSSDGHVNQTISYYNIGNGTVIQWGESGDMPRQERTLNLDNVGDSGFIWQWNKSDVNQTINVKNSENVYLKQIIGGLKKILFPDAKAIEDQTGSWTFCGKAVNGTGGMPLCAKKIAERIFNGKANARDYYFLEYLEEEYGVFPPDNLTPHIILTKWNITKVNGNLTIKFRAQNFGKKTYNSTLKLYLTPKINIIGLDGNNIEKVQARGNRLELNAEDKVTVEDYLNGEIKIPENQTIEIGKYTIPRMKGTEQEVAVPLNGSEIKNLKLIMISN